MAATIFPTSLVGSYPQPKWLIDRARLSKMVPRVRMDDLWLVDPKRLEVKQDKATRLAIQDQEDAGLDIITDGEQRRESYSNRFATALEGVDTENPGSTLNRSGKPIPVPRVTGKIRRKHPVAAARPAIPARAHEEDHKDDGAGPVHDVETGAERILQIRRGDGARLCGRGQRGDQGSLSAGADIVQLDEPWMQQHPEKAREYGLKALDRALDGVTGTVAVHLCFGYAAVVHDKPTGYSFLPELEGSRAAQVSIEAAQPKLDLKVLEKLPSKTIILGVIDLSDLTVETPEVVAERIRKALPYVPAERIVVAPDCGMKYLPRDVAFGKMQAMVAGAEIVRRELGS